MNRAEIESHHLTTLRAMFSELIPANRFYSKKLKECNFDKGPEDLREFFSKAPFTTKAEVIDDQLANPPYGTNLTYPIDRYTRFSQTSGTMGTPLRWLDTNEGWSWMVDRWVEVFHASGVSSGDRVLFAFSFGPFLGFWTSFQAAARMGCMCLPGGGVSSAARLQMMFDNSATVLCCTPTYAIRLGEVAIEEDIQLEASTVRVIIVAGEPGAGIPSTRARIEKLWPHAQIRDHHGMTETGPVTFECPERRGVLHVMETGYIPEVIEPESGHHVEDGREGELVLTNLGRLCSPLIRYRTGDLVKPVSQSPCACGRYDLALEGGILGRIDDMVVVRGVNIFPSAIEDVIRRFEQVSEYRVEFCTDDALSELNVQLEPVPECTDSARLAENVQAALRDTFHLRIPVTVVASGSLPRFEMKAKRWFHMHRERPQ